MGLKIRLARAGAKKRPYYHIVVADSRSPRDGRFIEKLGSYNPMLPAEHADRVRLQPERIEHWLSTRRARHRTGGEVPRPGRPGADAGLERTADPVRAEEEGAGACQGGRGRGGGLSVPDRRIQLGVIGRAHGVRGLVRVTSHTADPAALTAYGPLSDATGRRFALRWKGDGIAEVSRTRRRQAR